MKYYGKIVNDNDITNKKYVDDSINGISVPTKTSDLTNDSGFIDNTYHDTTKQDKLTNQTAYSNKGTATKVPQITTNNLGQVTNITEVNITQPTVNDATLTIQRNGSNVGTFSANASANKTVNITVPTTATDVNAIPKAFGTGTIAGTDGARTAAQMYGGNLTNGALIGANLINLARNVTYRCYERGATVTCNYSNVYSSIGNEMFDGGYSGYYDKINPSTMFGEKPFVLELTRPTAFEYTDVCRLLLLGHRFASFRATKYKIEVAYAYSNGIYSWATAVNYSGVAVDMCQTYYGLYCTEAGIADWHPVYGIRLTISESPNTVLQISQIEIVTGRGTENISDALHFVPDQGGRFYGNIEAAQFKKTGGTSSQFLKADGSVDSNTYGKITEIRMNGASKGTSGVVDLGNVATSADIANKEDKSNKTNSYTESSTTTYPNTKALVDGLATKQATLVSGINIKTVNGQSLLGSGDIAGGLIDDVKVNGTSVVSNKIANIDLTDYAKEDDIPTKTSDLTNDNGFITASDNITGNAATATKATNDKNGNRIDTTYMTISNPTGTGNFIMNEGTHKYSLGNYVTLEGYKTDTTESYTHAEGYKTKAYGMASHTEGWETVAGVEYQHVQGKYNVYDNLITETALDIIGNGTSDTERKNIELTTSNGTKRLKGNVYVECNDDSSGGKKVATEEYVSNYHDNTKQDKLVSGTNVKTINNQSILGSGNITIQGGGISLDILQPFEAIV